MQQNCLHILKDNKHAKIIILGDFNDEPSNKSLNEVLKATNNKYNLNNGELFNLMYDKHLFGYGTYNYKGNWNMLDNIIISHSLLNSKGKGSRPWPRPGRTTTTTTTTTILFA